MLDQVPQFKSSQWQAARRHGEKFLTARVRMFTVKCAAGDFEGADRLYTDLLQTMDELLQLAGAER